MGIKQWILPAVEPEAEVLLRQHTGLPAPVCRVLCARGLNTAERAGAFLRDDSELSNPFLIKDMDKAAERVRRAIESDERIAVYGDYDCDGVTATALLTSYLQSVGGDAFYYIPDREREGYGLNLAAVDTLREQGASLIITVDNGVSSHEEVAYAARYGIDVVITDHHSVPKVLPEAVAVVNPNREDCESGLKGLAGVGVAFKLVCALDEDESCAETLEFYSDLVMLGTVADVSPLTGENRIIVRHGLNSLAQTERAGLRALIECAGVAGREITAETVAYTLVPRLNAAGRMGCVENAIELLLTDDDELAAQLAAEINSQNEKRKGIEDDMIAQIIKTLSEDPALSKERIMTAVGEGWHHGVVGIVSARMVDRFGKPCLIFSTDGEEARASGRSLPGFSLIDAITACSGRLTRYGGHTLAAGLTLPAGELDDFIREFQDYVREKYPVMPSPSMKIDCELLPGELTVRELEALSRLEPFGPGNRAPLFLLEDLVVERVTPTSDGKHLRMCLRNCAEQVRAVFFRKCASEFPYKPGDKVDIVANISVSPWGGRMQISVMIRDIRPNGVDQQALLSDKALYEGHLRGEYADGARQALIPSRDDIAAVYRFLRKNPEFRHTSAEMYYRMGKSGVTYARMLVAVDTLVELGLVERAASERGPGILRYIPDPPRVDLADSAILRGLSSK